jgi:hypothetical protein
MRKTFITLLVVCFVAFGSGSALATSYYAPSDGLYFNTESSQVDYFHQGDNMGSSHWSAVPGIGQGGTGDLTATLNGQQKQKQQQNSTNTNTATGGSATIAKDAVKNTNENNVNIGGGILSKTLSPEASAQQKQQMNNEQNISPSQVTTISNYVEDKRELPVNPTYQAPTPGEYRGPFTDGIFKKIAPWSDQKVWTQEEIDNFPGAGKVSMSDSGLQKSASFTLVTDYEMQEGQRSFYIIVEGDKGDSPLHVWGRAANKALKNGATQVKILGVAYTFSTSGTGWNIGLGGGVNAINGGKDTFGGSVGGGTGYGSFQVGPIERMSIALRCYGFNPTK